MSWPSKRIKESRHNHKGNVQVEQQKIKPFACNKKELVHHGRAGRRGSMRDEPALAPSILLKERKHTVTAEL